MAINLNDIMAEDFQIVVEEYVERNKNLLDTMSKYQTASSRLNRAVTKAATQCGLDLAYGQEKIRAGQNGRGGQALQKLPGGHRKGNGRCALLSRGHVQCSGPFHLRCHAQGKADALCPWGVFFKIARVKEAKTPLFLFPHKKPASLNYCWASSCSAWRSICSKIRAPLATISGQGRAA